MSKAKSDVSKLKKYFQSLEVSERDNFAISCNTTCGQLNQIIYQHRSCNPVLAIELEKQSGGQILCDELCPDVDWEYLRSRSPVEVAS